MAKNKRLYKKMCNCIQLNEPKKIIIYKLLLYLTGTPVKKAANAAISAAKGAFKKQ